MQNWLDLPLELLSSVMAYLEIKDNIRASVVCKSWYEAAVSVRVVEQPPWFFHLPNSGDSYEQFLYSTISTLSNSNSYELYDPSNGKKYKLELPESQTDYIIHYSTYGWLLMSNSVWSEFFFFDPFTKKTVVFPCCPLRFMFPSLAFSSAPTSSSCVVFMIKVFGPGDVIIGKLSLGQTWTSGRLKLNKSIVLEYDKIIFSNGLFYCVNSRNSLAVFDPSLCRFDVLDIPPPRPSDLMDSSANWYKGNFMVEHRGHIYLICSYDNNDHMVFELNLEQGIWEEKRSLGSLTMFVSMTSCELTSYVGDGMKRNSIYFPKLCCNKTCTMSYSFHERRYSPCEDNDDWGEYPFQGIWIKPPQNVSELLSSNL